MNNSFFEEIEEGKKTIIFVPHQDDEINISGGLIPILIKKQQIVKVVYSTNGDYCANPKNRYYECFKALKKLGIPSENILFMGYSDQYSSGETHIYLTEGNNVWKSNKRFKETYHALNGKEVSCIYTGNHSKFNKRSFINDIKCIIEHEMPDYLFCIDFDSHADHRALSLSFEIAIGEILKTEKNYRPKVYKSFAYPTSYFGINDFKKINIASTNFKTEKYSYNKMENPYYKFSDRIRIPLLNKSITKFILKNKTFKSLRCHKSQAIVGKCMSIINGDQVFWQRRTDNLLYNAIIKVSSGDKEKLNDFMMFDCQNIMNGNTETPILLPNAWVPDKKDINPTIDILFNKETEFNTIKFYHSLNEKTDNIKIEIAIDDKCKKHCILYKNNNTSEIELENTIAKKIVIKILENECEEGFSEIEILNNKKQNNKFLKLELNGDFAYKYYYNNEEFRVYAYDGFESRYLSKEKYNLISESVEVKKNRFVLKKKINYLKIVSTEDERIYDECILIKKSAIDSILNECTYILNKLLLFIIYNFQRIIKKIKRIF